MSAQICVSHPDADGIESLSDVDDDEIEGYILNEEEMNDKCAIWHEVNRDFLVEWEIREQNKKRFAEGNTKRRVARKLEPADSAIQGAQLAIERKAPGLASRINTEALLDLFA